MSILTSCPAKCRVISLVCLYMGILVQGLQPVLAESDEQLEKLAERATQYWEARVADDPITMYDFEASGVQGTMSLRDYVRKGGGIAYNSAVLKDVERVDDDEAVAVMDVEFRVRALGGDWLNQEVRSHWVLIDGEWYHGDRVVPGDQDQQDGETSN